MDPRLTRRRFLAGAAGTAGALGLAACHKSSVINVPLPGSQALNLLVTSGAVDGPSDQSVSVFETTMDQRVAFVLAGSAGFLSPTPGSVTLQFSTDEKHFGAPVPLEVHGDTSASASTYLVTTYRFPAPGTYFLRATFKGQSADSPIVAIPPGQARVPFAGQGMISTPTPTVTDARGVDPICTRVPLCPFHTQSLDAVLTQGLPVALIFATPFLCSTATCGPVLDTLVTAAPAFAGKINFVHSEIFVNKTSRNVPNTPAVLAYHLQSEPLLFLADAHGKVVERIDGLFGIAEVTAALTRLAAG